jgi:DNA invertase Pin-like site-specific DNA recombinase
MNIAVNVTSNLEGLMAAGKFIAYYRVSTKRQGKSGLGLEAQKSAVAEYLNGGNWTLVDEVTEIESGKRNDRPALEKALALCRVYGAKLVVAKMDRLSRNLHFLTGLMESGVDFVACDLPAANKLTIHLLAAVAEAEGEAIASRTKAALAAAKARGVRLGGDRGNIRSICRQGAKASAYVRQQSMLARAAGLVPVIEDVRSNGARSLREIAAALTRRGISAPRGGDWAAAQVQRVLRAQAEWKL